MDTIDTLVHYGDAIVLRHPKKEFNVVKSTQMFQLLMVEMVMEIILHKHWLICILYIKHMGMTLKETNTF